MIRPPGAKRQPTVHQRVTGDVIDDWHWLRNRDDPDTIPYLEAENHYVDDWLAARAETIESIFGEIKGRTVETDLTVPVPHGPWEYFSRTVEGQSYSIHCRRPLGAAPGEQDRDLLDENAEAQRLGGDFFSLGNFDISPSHRYLLWAADTDGGERHVLRVRDLTTGADLDDVIDNTYYGTAWSLDESTMFYTRPDHVMRGYQIWRHRLGSAVTDDVCVFTEEDDRFEVSVGSTRSGRYIIIDSRSKTTGETQLIDATSPEASATLVRARREGHEYSVDHQGERLLILSNEHAEDFAVYEAPVDNPGTWSELIAGRAGRRINDVNAFDGFFVVSAMNNGTDTLTVVRGKEVRLLTFDEPVHSIAFAVNPEYRTDTIRFHYQSMATPPSVYDEQVESGQRVMRKQQPVIGFDPTQYVTRREWAKSYDGELVPLDIVARTTTPLDGTAPCVLYGYGSYEASIPPYFSIARLSLLDRGAVFALAHPRGGGEMGRQWYLHGKLLEKRNTFLDFIACAEHLGSRLVDPSRIVIRGGSAGGLLVGASVTMRPDLFSGVVAEVPFVDVVNSMNDATLPLTITEWDEWGNPADEPFASYMLSYSPYDQTTAPHYPPIYITAGLNDPRVAYHEPAKWTAKLRATSDTTVFLRTELGGGHGGPSGRYDAWRDDARVLTFVLWALGLVE
jgi:oligopeptidase B